VRLGRHDPGGHSAPGERSRERLLRIADRTLVLVFGDHGEAFGEHPGNVGHSLFLNEENLRVPYVIALPGRINGAWRAHRLASLIDTAPTILDLVGLPQATAHQGLSLLRPGEPMALFHTDYSLGWLGLRDGCWKYLFEVDAGRSKLFDVCRDPDETVDRAGANGDRVRAYHDRVIAWSAAERDLVLSSYTSRR
jgi:arylsulfatase A-like enzyme